MVGWLPDCNLCFLDSDQVVFLVAFSEQATPPPGDHYDDHDGKVC